METSDEHWSPYEPEDWAEWDEFAIKNHIEQLPPPSEKLGVPTF
jgi:hypothetical protein